MSGIDARRQVPLPPGYRVVRWPDGRWHVLVHGVTNTAGGERGWWEHLVDERGRKVEAATEGEARTLARRHWARAELQRPSASFGWCSDCQEWRHGRDAGEGARVCGACGGPLHDAPPF